MRALLLQALHSLENRNGLLAAAMATTPDGYAERDAALELHGREKNRSKQIKTAPHLPRNDFG